MLEKVMGTPRLNKLRDIQLIEADLNMVLQIVFGHREKPILFGCNYNEKADI
jgi:hypothetical protein